MSCAAMRQMNLREHPGFANQLTADNCSLSILTALKILYIQDTSVSLADQNTGAGIKASAPPKYQFTILWQFCDWFYFSLWPAT